MNTKVASRIKRHRRVRRKITGSSGRPRLAVFRSNKHIYAQLIDDLAGRTLISASSVEPSVQKDGQKKEVAKRVGVLLGERAKSAGISAAVFDRGGRLYHGRVQSLAEGAREAGLEL